MIAILLAIFFAGLCLVAWFFALRKAIKVHKTEKVVLSETISSLQNELKTAQAVLQQRADKSKASGDQDQNLNAKLTQLLRFFNMVPFKETISGSNAWDEHTALMLKAPPDAEGRDRVWVPWKDTPVVKSLVAGHVVENRDLASQLGIVIENTQAAA